MEQCRNARPEETREISEKTRRPAASSGRIPSCDRGLNRFVFVGERREKRPAGGKSVTASIGAVKGATGKLDYWTGCAVAQVSELPPNPLYKGQTALLQQCCQNSLALPVALVLLARFLPTTAQAGCEQDGLVRERAPWLGRLASTEHRMHSAGAFLNQTRARAASVHILSILRPLGNAQAAQAIRTTVAQSECTTPNGRLVDLPYSQSSRPCSEHYDTMCARASMHRLYIASARSGKAGVTRENPPAIGNIRYVFHKQEIRVTRPGNEPGSPWCSWNSLTTLHHRDQLPSGVPSSIPQAIFVPMRVNQGEYGAAPERKGGGRGRSPRKLTDQWRRPARFPLVRLLASPLGEAGSILGGSAHVFSHVGIVPDAALVGGFSRGLSRFIRPCIPVLLHTHLTSPSSALKTSMLEHRESLCLSELYRRPRLTREQWHEARAGVSRHGAALVTARRCRLRQAVSTPAPVAMVARASLTWSHLRNAFVLSGPGERPCQLSGSRFLLVVRTWGMKENPSKVNERMLVLSENDMLLRPEDRYTLLPPALRLYSDE
ncbi:hypothetical protein PR048_027491 [Dryococelus australis]|uniref:Uncharacterized protein n=1 Tax=Dryococelus australis TaxID=614101 RepID=A0ABQ9GFL6_9NEOP|nr:hypothetical protein PR048_027491 [Dryococelus australis]